MPETGRKDANRRYWREYSNLQGTKHALIQCYLNGWLPKLGSWSGRILYLDTHAGRGRYLSGEYGSPLVAVKSALEHKHRAAVFGRCEIIYFFIEIDEESASALKKEIESLGPLPERIRIEVVVDDCYEALGCLLDDVRQSSKKLAPAFVFVDPYGLAQLRDGPKRWHELIEDVRAEVWSEKQLNDVIRELRRRGKIAARGAGRFAKKNNPELSLVDES